MKLITFLGSSLEDLKQFPVSVKRDVGFQLDKVQNGYNPANWKPMQSIGSGVREIRIKDDAGIYRVIYLAKLKDTVLVLHAFVKKSQKTSKQDLAIANKRLKHFLKRY